MNKELINRYINIINSISITNNYDNNIKHLLYLIIPAFITKYKYKEQLILDVFKNTPIIISNKEEKYINAYYTSIPRKIDNNIATQKYIIINNYNKISLITLLDSLVHEYNHAINSYKTEILIKNNTIYIRTGLTYITYYKDNLKPKEKLPSYILEEIINTKQTETIIDLIKNYQDKSNDIINNTIYAINNETNKNYNSNAYYLETNILKPLLTNKTFIYTLESLRLEGQIDDIESWFNNITNIKNSYQTLINDLNKLIELEKQLTKTKLFKSRIISKIKSTIKDLNYIINIFNENSHNH